MRKCYREAARELIGSDAIDAEAAANPDAERRRRVQVLAGAATAHIHATSAGCNGHKSWREWGFRGYDSLHVAFAEAAGADILLTTDDAFVRRARRLQHDLRVRVANPVTWLKEGLE